MMSVIVAVSDGENIVMGADGASSSGNEIYTLDDPKVGRVGELLVGGCGLGRGIYAIRQRMQWPMPGADLQAWRLEVENLIKETLGAVGLVYQCEEMHAPRAQVQTLVGVRGKIFHIDQSFCTGMKTDVSVIGAGRAQAYGAIHAARSLGASIEEQVRAGLSASAQYCVRVSEPFTVLSSSGPLAQPLSAITEHASAIQGKRHNFTNQLHY